MEDGLVIKIDCWGFEYRISGVQPSPLIANILMQTNPTSSSINGSVGFLVDRWI